MEKKEANFTESLRNTVQDAFHKKSQISYNMNALPSLQSPTQKFTCNVDSPISVKKGTQLCRR